MEQQNTRLRNAGFATFFFSGICAISAGVVVSLLQERYGFAYGMTGTLLSLMSVGNLLAGLLMGMLPSALGMKRSVLLLTIGYAAGYAVMGLTGAVALLAVAFFVVGIAKGSVINTCTILVSDHSADRTRGMNLMHSCYACGALLCPFLIAAAARVSTELAVFLLAAVGLVLWLVYVFTPLRGGKGKSNAEKEAIDWSFLRSARFWLLTGLLFGGWTGGLAAGIGSALFDLTYPEWAAGAWLTFIFFFAMGAICGGIAHAGGAAGKNKARNWVAAICGAVGYWLLYIGKSIVVLCLGGSVFSAAFIATVPKMLTGGINAVFAIVVSNLLAALLRPKLESAGIYEALKKH